MTKIGFLAFFRRKNAYFIEFLTKPPRFVFDACIFWLKKFLFIFMGGSAVIQTSL